MAFARGLRNVEFEWRLRCSRPGRVGSVGWTAVMRDVPDGRWLRLAPAIFLSMVTPLRGPEPAWESAGRLLSHPDLDQAAYKGLPPAVPEQQTDSRLPLLRPVCARVIQRSKDRALVSYFLAFPALPLHPGFSSLQPLACLTVHCAICRGIDRHA